MGTGQTFQEEELLDFYALMPLHAATVPGMRWYNHQMDRYLVVLLCIKIPLLDLDSDTVGTTFTDSLTEDVFANQEENWGLDLGIYDKVKSQFGLLTTLFRRG